MLIHLAGLPVWPVSFPRLYRTPGTNVGQKLLVAMMSLFIIFHVTSRRFR